MEACGIMKGRLSIVDGVKISEVLKVYRTKNIHPNPLRGYRMHAEDQYRVYVELDPELELVGFYHSHPHGPSKTDIYECNYHTTPFSSSPSMISIIPTSQCGYYMKTAWKRKK